MPQVSNHYAAMPSMHFGYALWVCTALAGLLKGGPFQPRSRVGWRCMLAAVGLYPASVLFCIIVSADLACLLWLVCCSVKCRATISKLSSECQSVCRCACIHSLVQDNQTMQRVQNRNPQHVDRR
jgi:hypothetical protein